MHFTSVCHILVFVESGPYLILCSKDANPGLFHSQIYQEMATTKSAKTKAAGAKSTSCHRWYRVVDGN